MSASKNTWGPKLTGWMQLVCDICSEKFDVGITDGEVQEFSSDMVWVEIPLNGQAGHLVPTCWDCAKQEYNKATYQPTTEPLKTRKRKVR